MTCDSRKQEIYNYSEHTLVVLEVHNLINKYSKRNQRGRFETTFPSLQDW